MGARDVGRRLLVGMASLVLLAGCGSSATPTPKAATATPSNVPSMVATPSPTEVVAASAAASAAPLAILTAFSLNNLTGFAVDAAGDIYTPGATDGYALVKLAPDGTVLAHWAGTDIVKGELDSIGWVALDPASGDVFATDTSADRVVHLTAGLQVTGTFGATGHASGQFTSPYGLAFDPAGHLLVVDTGNNRIETFTRDGTLLSVWDAPGGMMDPVDLAIDAHGNLYVSGLLPLDFSGATNVAGQVIEFSPARQPLLTLQGAAAGSSFSFPDAAVDAAGEILVDDNSGSIFTFSPTGKLLRQWPVWPQNSSPGVVRVAPSGQVYASGCISVADCRIVALDAKGSIGRTWDSATPPDHPGSKVPTGRGYSLYLQCAGSGSPTVLWEAGSGDGGSGELPQYLLGRLASITRVCFYDRAGLGLSDPAPYQPDAGGAQMIADLHAVLQRAAVPGPYVLVGYSLGGLLNRLFAATYPKELAGMVQVDGVSEDFLPDLGCTDTSCPLYSSITALHDAIHGKIAGSLGALPLVLLTHNPALPAWGASSEPDFDKTEQALATASSNAVHVEATWSSHMLPFSQPGLVIEAVREVVAAARSSDHTLPRCGAAFTQLGGKCL